MELLDMVPADAIALRIYSLPAAAAAVGSLCAWLVAALAAAAVGIWRIRAVSASSKPGSSGSAVAEDGQVRAARPPPALDEPRAEAAASRPSSEPSTPCTPSKVRFMAYYGSADGDEGEIDGVRRCADDDVEEDGEAERVVLRRTVSEPGRRRSAAEALAPWAEREILAARRRSDLGWYRHLDMAALDGSVVRLWDGELTASPRRRRRAALEYQLSL